MSSPPLQRHELNTTVMVPWGSYLSGFETQNLTANGNFMVVDFTPYSEVGIHWNVCELQGNEDKASEFPKTGPVVLLVFELENPQPPYAN